MRFFGAFGASAPPKDISDADLVTRRVDTVLFAATTNCNLRCTYCAVSLPTYVGEDFDFSKAKELATQFRRVGVRLVQVSGHGETTILPDWQKFCAAFTDEEIDLCITSNFSRIFSEDELATLAKMAFINISIDTVDRALLLALRRKVDLRTILYNMTMVRLYAQRIGRISNFNWQCTLSDAVVNGLDDWLDLGILNGVRAFTLGNLIAHEDLPDSPKHIAKLKGDALNDAAKKLSAFYHRALKAGVVVTVQPGIVEGLSAAFRAAGTNAPYILGE